MTVKKIMETLNLKLAAGENGLLKQIKGVYICDLLSWVMAHGKLGDIWITIQTHPNVIAVASLLELSCIIIPENAELEEDTINKANAEGIPILISAQSGYSLCCQLYDIAKAE